MATPKLGILEGYPKRLKERIEKRNIKRARLGSAVPRFRLVMENVKLWRVGTLTCSFKGGNTELHKLIADTASEWSKHANIVFDFGYNTKTKKYRKWKKGDTSHIRIGFEQEGYWSLLGTESQDTDLAKPGEITLNLEAFDRELPENWKFVILHEFGHALGFHHEHQSPVSDCDFNWPFLYEQLGGPPNNWDKETVDFNMKEMRPRGLTYSAHDKASIMHYSFDHSYFLSGKKSPCYTKEGKALSKEDKAMAAKAYPFKPGAVKKMDVKRIKDLETLNSKPEIDPSTKKFIGKNLSYYKKNAG